MNDKPVNDQPVHDQTPKTAADTSADQPWPVRLLTTKISRYIMRMPAAWVEGQLVEISRRGDSSVVFLTLRDPDVDMSLSVTTGRQVLDAMPTPVVEGARVVARVVPQYFERRGRFSLTALELRPVGVGALLAQVEHLRQLLAAEGLFDTARKKPLPFAPGLIGLVCGRASDAERDVLVNSSHRWPSARFELRQVPVQGGSAVAAVCQAVTELDAHPEVEVIVIARGGGALEDLLPFSNETLLRTVAACRTPVVSAIGHEADTPLLDLVADVRASTPTDAAKRIVPDVQHELASLQQARERLRRAVTRRVDDEQARLRLLRASRGLAEPASLIDQQDDLVCSYRDRARHQLRARLDRAADDVAHLLARTRTLSPRSTLQRGYAVVLSEAGHVIGDAATLTPGDGLQVVLADGRLDAEVRTVHRD